MKRQPRGGYPERKAAPRRLLYGAFCSTMVESSRRVRQDAPVVNGVHEVGTPASFSGESKCVEVLSVGGAVAPVVAAFAHQLGQAHPPGGELRVVAVGFDAACQGALHGGFQPAAASGQRVQSAVFRACPGGGACPTGGACMRFGSLGGASCLDFVRSVVRSDAPCHDRAVRVVEFDERPMPVVPCRGVQ